MRIPSFGYELEQGEKAKIHESQRRMSITMPWKYLTNKMMNKRRPNNPHIKEIDIEMVEEELDNQMVEGKTYFKGAVLLRILNIKGFKLSGLLCV